MSRDQVLRLLSHLHRKYLVLALLLLEQGNILIGWGGERLRILFIIDNQVRVGEFQGGDGP